MGACVSQHTGQRPAVSSVAINHLPPRAHITYSSPFSSAQIHLSAASSFSPLLLVCTHISLRTNNTYYTHKPVRPLHFDVKVSSYQRRSQCRHWSKNKGMRPRRCFLVERVERDISAKQQDLAFHWNTEFIAELSVFTPDFFGFEETIFIRQLCDRVSKQFMHSFDSVLRRLLDFEMFAQV